MAPTLQKIILSLFFLTLLSPVSGELLRFPVGGFSALPADLLLPFLIFFWLIYKFKFDPALRLGRIGQGILLFIFVLLITFFINALHFPIGEMIHAGAYMVRLLAYLLLYFIGYDLLNTDTDLRTPFLYCVTGVALILTILGFLQLYFFPSFLDLGYEIFGWDPHHFRLFSTWFDPNFIGGFLAFSLSFIGVLFFAADRPLVQKIFLIMTALALVLAIYFTYSRSAYLALVSVLMVWALLKSPKFLIGLLVIFLLGLTFSDRFHERIVSAYRSGQTLFGLDTQYPLDPTARLRVDSWRYAGEMMADHPWVGVGYNRYPFEVNQRGYVLLSDHAAGGSDSSLLTLGATTGIVGLLPFLAIFVIAAHQATFLFRQPYPFSRVFGIGALAALTALLVHAIFVNSLLLPWMMIYLWPLMALIDYSHHRLG